MLVNSESYSHIIFPNSFQPLSVTLLFLIKLYIIIGIFLNKLKKKKIIFRSLLNF